MAESALKQLTSGRVLARNTLYSLAGQCAPLLVAVFAIPLLIKGLGTDRFGLLTLAWMVISYFSLFDLGLGRALTQLVAEKLGAGQDREIPALVWTSLLLMLVMGLVGALVVSLLSPWLTYQILKIPETLQHETLYSLYLLAVSIPVVTTTAGLRGILEAKQRFDLVSAVRIPMGVLMFCGPLPVLPFFPKNLFAVVAVLVVVRLVVWLAHLLLCFAVMPALRKEVVLEPEAIGPLLRFGSWMTVTNIISPLMVYIDRLLIGAFISISAVAYYTTPFEVVSKISLIPWALVGVLFPAFSTSFLQDRNRTTLLFDRGIRYLFLALFPITLLFVTFAYEGLDLWLGYEFAQNSTVVLQWLAIGVFINSFSYIPFALVQGAGRPDLTAKMHMIELPFYLLAVCWLTSTYGIIGAAIALVLRVGVDTAILFFIAWKFLPNDKSTIRRKIFALGAALFTLTLATLMAGILMKILFLLLTLLTFGCIMWVLAFETREKLWVRSWIKGLNVKERLSKQR